MLKTLLCTTVLGTALVTGAWAQTMSPSNSASPSNQPATSAPSNHGSDTMSPTSPTSPTTPPSKTGPAINSGVKSSTDMNTGTSATTDMTTTASAGPANAIVGDDVKDDHGKSIGKIDNVLVSADGKVQRVVLSVGGVLGVGAKKVAVSWNDLTMNPADNSARVTMSKDELEKAPEYKEPENRSSSVPPAGSSSTTH